MSVSNFGGSVKLDLLFLGLTRPAFIMGVTYNFFALNFLISTIYFTMTSDFKVMLFMIFIHFFGVFLCKKEPLAVDILIMKLSKTGKSMNKNFYGSNVYSFY